MAGASYDVAIVGAGPNGLTAAAYLARAGARVVVLEKRFERGGTFATDDYSTPHQYNLVQFALPLGHELPPYAELELERHGVRFLEPAIPFAARAEPGGEELLVGRGGEGLGDEVAGMLAASSEALTPLLYEAPPGEEALLERLRGDAPGAARLAGLSPNALAELAADARGGVVLRYACLLAGFLDGDAPLGAIGGYAVARQFSPSLVAGGTKNLANALARVAVLAGARSFVSSEVVSVEGEQGAFRLALGDGRELEAGAVVSTLDPRSTFLELLGGELVPAELRAAAEGWESEGAGQFTAHFGIRGEPPAPAGGERGDALQRVFGFASAAEVEARARAALAGELPERVAGHLTAVSAHDPLQASPGPYGPLHTLRLQTLVPFEHPSEAWERARPSYRQACWDAATEHFDGLGEARLLFQFADPPTDIERRFGTTRGGSPRQGALTPGQTLANRPHPQAAGGRLPVPGLYLGGGGAHPGVPGTLAAGRSVAALVGEDLGLERAPLARA